LLTAEAMRASLSSAVDRRDRRAADGGEQRQPLSPGSSRRFERLEAAQVDAADPVSLDNDHHHAGAVPASDDRPRPAQIDGELTNQATPSTTRACAERGRQLRAEDRHERDGDCVSVKR
jgi:hypothetical protein